MAIYNARLHAREEEEHHIQKDVVLVGFGQWGQKAYAHLELLKNFFNFRTHVVELEWPGRREALAEAERKVLQNGDLFYWDVPDSPAPALDALTRELEPSCYVITYICTPAESHLPMLKAYYGLSNVVLIEKPLGAPPEEYREFLDQIDGSVQIVAADHYWFKLEIRLLEQLLTEEQNLRAFLDQIEEVEIEILEEQPPGGSGAQIGMIADLIPHAFAILSLLTPLDRLKLAEQCPLQIGRYQPQTTDRETFARLRGSFDFHGRSVGVTIDVGKGVANAKWIKLSGERHKGGRRAFYKFDFGKGEAIDGTQSTLRAATRPIRQPGVPDNAHLNMLRHVIEKKNPAVGILAIHEAIRANARIQALERLAAELMEAGEWTAYEQGQRPAFPSEIPAVATVPVGASQ
jgi:predicted dehydrogenase